MCHVVEKGRDENKVEMRERVGENVRGTGWVKK